MNFKYLNTPKSATNSIGQLVSAPKSALFSVLLFSSMLLGSIGAQAMLPTPEPELDNLNNTLSNNLTHTANTQTSATNNLAAQVQTKTVAALVSLNSQGQKTLKPVDSNTRLKKGNVIEYHTYFTNKSSDRIRKMNVYMSIPDEVKLLGNVEPDTASASVNGQNFNRMPLRGRINGELKDIPLEYYKQLRWTIEGLGVNETAVVKYRALVR